VIELPNKPPRGNCAQTDAAKTARVISFGPRWRLRQNTAFAAFLVREKPASVAWAVATVAIDKALSDNAFCFSSRSAALAN
jgi:hypothetical protein